MEEIKVFVENKINCSSILQQRTNRDMYDEVIQWQRDIQERSVEETQNILNVNLEQILKVS